MITCSCQSFILYNCSFLLICVLSTLIVVFVICQIFKYNFFEVVSYVFSTSLKIN